MGIEQVLIKYKPLVKSAIEKWIPREFSDVYLEQLCGSVSYEHNAASLTQSIALPVYDMLDRGGKSWRPALFLLIAEAFGKSVEDVIDFTVICEVVHNGTLIIDDIEDKSTHRRGKPCSHIIFGTDVAGTLPDSVLIKLYELYITELSNVHVGQGYGALARLAGLTSAYVSGASEVHALVIGNFCEAIGVAFQIQDDILCIVGKQFAEGKGGIGEDIREGKRTLMVIHALQHASKEKADRLTSLLNKHTSDDAEVLECIALLQDTGSVDYARVFAKDLVTKAWVNVAPVLPEGDAKENLRLFADYLIERSV